jgi:2-polyprenyl-3-methyl-5-hydroxy-6-metoxy-1,4-benzoquinol methylase
VSTVWARTGAESDPPETCPIPCNLCGSTGVDELSLRDRDGRYLRTTICRACGLVWSNPRPVTRLVRRYYSSEYRLDYKGRRTPSLRHVARSARGALVRYAGLKPFLRSGDVVLDVGAGSGELVYVLRSFGYDALGIEPDEHYARHAREALGVPVETGFVQDGRLEPESLDVVTMYHCLEHFEDPSGVLTKVRQWLRPHGRLAIEVPNVEATCLAPRHRFHFAHFFSFNQATLEALGRKSGFEPLRTTTSPDGGNLSSVFEAASESQPVRDLTGNCARIVSALADHRAWSFYLSSVPYTGALARLRAYLSDSGTARECRDARQVLDAVVSRAGSHESDE